MENLTDFQHCGQDYLKGVYVLQQRIWSREDFSVPYTSLHINVGSPIPKACHSCIRKHWLINERGVWLQLVSFNMVEADSLHSLILWTICIRPRINRNWLRRKNWHRHPPAIVCHRWVRIVKRAHVVDIGIIWSSTWNVSNYIIPNSVMVLRAEIRFEAQILITRRW